MTVKLCEGCAVKPPAYCGRRWCYDCKAGSAGRPLPCRRCGSTSDYWSAGLCRRCHQNAPQRPESCRDCLAWGVRRTDKWLCGGCQSWRVLHPTSRHCVGCGQLRPVNEHEACRLCWRQANRGLPRLSRGRRGPLDVTGVNRYGQQLFLANVSSSKNGYRPPAAALPAEPGDPPPRPGSRVLQMDLFTPDPIAAAARRYGVPDPADPRLARTLDDAVREHAAAHGWRPDKTERVRTAVRVLLGRRGDAELPIRASEITHLTRLELPARPVRAVLNEAGAVREDRPDPITVWFERQTGELPDPMRGELRIWFDVLHDGSSTPPRTRPRNTVTIKVRVAWTLPTLQMWAATGHRSLREISRDDVLAVLPAGGTPRATLGAGLRSIFTTLKARKVIFINPLNRVPIGNMERRTPLPADPTRLQAALTSADPATAALAALLIFHGLRPLEARRLKLTDIRDGRLYLPDRTIPLATPARQRLTAYLDHRHSRWPDSANPHLLINRVSADSTTPVGTHWVRSHLGMSAQAIRADRIVDETYATPGDLRRICDFFGVTMNTAEHYASSLNHPALRGNSHSIRAGSRTEATS